MIQLKFALAQWIKYFLGFCKTIIKPWIKSQISYFTFQDREDQLTILWAKEYRLIFFLSYVFLGSFNSMTVMALQVQVLTSFHQDKKTRDEAKILIWLRFSCLGCPRQNCEVRTEENIVNISILSTSYFQMRKLRHREVRQYAQSHKII